MELLSSAPVVFSPLKGLWVPHSDRLVVVGAYPDGKGAFSVRKVDQDLRIQPLRDVEKASGFRCAAMGVQPSVLRQVVTGQYNGQVSLWDLDHLQSPVWSGKHSQLVNSVHCGDSKSSTRPEILSSCRDGTVNLWDTRVADRPVMLLRSSSRSSDCWVAKFGTFFIRKEDNRLRQRTELSW